MISNENIVEKIRQTRLFKGLSQENLADMLNISTTAYGDIERNKTELTIPRLLRICQILDLQINEILGINASNQAFIELENEKLKIENEKLRLEVNYWKDRFERAVLIDALRAIKQQEQIERPKIGFTVPQRTN